jgi:hypothetical protein
MKKVYLLANLDDGHYKIGITSGEVSKRIKQLQTGNSIPIDIVSVFESDFHSKIERILHRKYKSKRLEGEWFVLGAEDVTNFLTECKKIHDNFKALSDYGNPFL